MDLFQVPSTEMFVTTFFGVLVIYAVRTVIYLVREFSFDDGQDEDAWIVENYARGESSKKNIEPQKKEEEKGKQSSARKVFVSLRILRLDSIDESADTFDSSMLLFLVWEDPSLTDDKNFGDELSVDEFEGNPKVFKPNITMPNMKEGQDDFWTPKGDSRPKVLPAFLLPGLFDADVKKILLHVLPVTGTFNEEYELGSFPFDVQKFHFIFRPKEDHRTVELCSLIGTRFNSTLSAFVQQTSPGFTIFYPRVECELDTVSMNRPYSTLKIVVIAERRSGFFIYTFYSMMIIVQLCTFMLFAGDYSVDNRFPNLLSLLLTITALKFVANEILPRISYTTMLDEFMFVSLGQLFLCCVESFALTVARDLRLLERMYDDSDAGQIVERWTYDGIDAHFAIFNVSLYVMYLFYYADSVLTTWHDNAVFVRKNNRLWVGSGHDDSLNMYSASERVDILKDVNRKYHFLSDADVEKRVAKIEAEARESKKNARRASFHGSNSSTNMIRQRRGRCLRYYFGG